MSETSARRIWNPAIDENIVQEKQDRIISEPDEKVPTSPVQVWTSVNFFFNNESPLDSFPTDAITAFPIRESVPQISTLLDAPNQPSSPGTLCEIHATISVESPSNQTVHYSPSSTRVKRTAGGDQERCTESDCKCHSERLPECL